MTKQFKYIQNHVEIHKLSEKIVGTCIPHVNIVEGNNLFSLVTPLARVWENYIAHDLVNTSVKTMRSQLTSKEDQGYQT